MKREDIETHHWYYYTGMAVGSLIYGARVQVLPSRDPRTGEPVCAPERVGVRTPNGSIRCLLPEELSTGDDARQVLENDDIEPPAASTTEFVPPKPRANLLWVGVDLDETLARGIWSAENPTSDIGPPIERNVTKVRKLAADGYKVHIHTSRPWHDVELIKAWLRFHGVPFHGVQCGKPLYAAYIDDRAIFAGDDNWSPKSKEERTRGHGL